MKKVLFTILAICFLFILTACGSKDNKELNDNNGTSQKENTDVNEIEKQQEENEYIIDNDEIVEYDDVDNGPIDEGYITIEKVINCDGCVYSYFSETKKIGSTLSESEYTTDINNLKTAGGKQRHNFFGFKLSGNKISRAYACILKDNKIYCIEGSVDGRYHTSNIGILNQIFTSDQCKTISAGHTYTCTDGNYNGDTITTGYASLHYETSCTIFGSEGNTGKMNCN